jgi:hypothetical protein
MTFRRGEEIPVRMFWNASSTLLASRAEVSMKERLFSPVDELVSEWMLLSRTGFPYLQIAWLPLLGPLSNVSNRSCFRQA